MPESIPSAVDHDYLNHTDTARVVNCLTCGGELARSYVLLGSEAVDAARAAHVCSGSDLVTLVRQYLADHDTGNALVAHLTLQDLRKRVA